MQHIDFLVEEPSAEATLKNLLPKICDVSHSIHSYNGKHDLLRKLSQRLSGYKKWIPSDYKIVVLIDKDGDDCKRLKKKLDRIAIAAGFVTKSSAQGRNFQILNRLAIEELEAWFFGDVQALIKAYPAIPANLDKKARYRNPDAIRGGTWEQLEKVLQKAGFFSAGLQKVKAASEISKHMVPERNQSKSFQVFVSGLKIITG